MTDHPLTLPEALRRLSAAQKPEDLFGPPQPPVEQIRRRDDDSLFETG